MGYWKSKVLPKIQKVFGKDAKKDDAIQACKSFDESKEEISKEFEEKKEVLQSKVVEIFEASSVEIKTLVKEPKEAGLRKHSIKVQKFLDELVKIEFPGSKIVSEATSKYGPVLVSGPVIFVFEKVSTFVVTEGKPREVEAKAQDHGQAQAQAQAPEPEPTTTTEETSVAEKEIAVEEDKPKEEPEAVEPAKA